MFRKCTVLFVLVSLLLTMQLEAVRANVQLSDYQDDNIHILVVFSNKQSKISPNIKELELLLKHFTNHVNTVSDEDISSDDVKSITHIFYYGEYKKEIDKGVLKILDNFSGSIIGIGENIEQMKAFQHFKQRGEESIQGIGQQNNGATHHLNYSVIVKRIEESQEMDTLLYGYKGSKEIPLLIQDNSNYYLATNRLSDDVLLYFFAELLHDILPNSHPLEHVAYIRLEDIHPASDPEKLLEVGEYLNERKIPYLLVVIPVYITPGTGERIYFSDSPELVEVLQHLQHTGGTVIAHGYTHQYRDSETGEGFEFWDVENEQFIISNEPKEDIETILSQEYFANKEDYTEYIDALKSKERQYIETRLIDSVSELVSYDLYPLAFEAPHYTMSQQGYEITGNYFSAIFGQLQYSDENWEIMGAPPYITSAHFLNEMTLLPETIGYVNMTEKYPFKEISNQVDNALIVRDSMIGGFYHPYLGVDHLPEFLKQYEKVPNLRWLDLKKTKQRVITEKVQIISDGTGHIEVVNELKWWDSIFRQGKSSLLEKILWGVTALVFTFVTLFLIITIYLRTQLKKRLFEERKNIG